ncbi:sensor histidine kinase/response regulator [Blastopirellula marina DSM 3645]|uniref:histidine kinase n=2 Tax=Blastopirellula marina TaxID=124 RepID=A4A0F8_9BACT|nr:sensor histidine kinase/response regulator [Blastopirellula marina DSM 3645]
MYLIPIALSLLAWRPQIPLAVAAVATLLMFATLVSDEPGFNLVIAQINRGCGIFTIWVMAIVAYFFVKNKLEIDLERWLQKGQTSLSKAMIGDPSLENLGDSVLKLLTEYTGAQVAVLFARDGKEFRRIASYGVPSNSDIQNDFTLEDGLLGRAVKDNRIFMLDDVPDGYLTLGSALGNGKPKHLAICPMAAEDITYAVLEIGFLSEVDGRTRLLLERVSESVAIAVRSANYRAHLQTLLEETQRQSEELQAQSEELRVANEELEEQGNALKETATRLELQQAELEQTNTQLEEQTQQLEAQRDDLARTKLSLQHQAADLERASRYKSDFLANMSHELRTPLNSSLILAKLLADNPQGNLSEEQVKFAKTIQSAGNDLLNLISDILDLSKIEAGQMELRLEQLRVQKLIDEVSRTMQPLARQKELRFETQIAPDCPKIIFTDRQRLEQVLKNLLSNAIKFTEQGEVKLSVTPLSNQRLALAVSDTGIGISEEQQQIVFEAFRQADSSSHRKHGGTGLGLSISKEFSRLLGGELRLESKPGDGSTFTLIIPADFDPTASPPTIASEESKEIAISTKSDSPPISEARPARKQTEFRLIEDDRDQLQGTARVILVVEDDPNFAQILYNLAHDTRFQCVVANTAEEAYAAALEYQPSAVILDVGLPDHSGLSVLDRLKNDARVRHIPVHVISGNDYNDSALSLGAIGFMLKPVKREEIIEVLQGLETRLAQRMRRVLVVEDDPVQLDSMHALLRSRDVETIGVQSAAECLEKLRSETFDCMVLDLTLPDASGYSLLETLSQEESYSFPPVIVYTGRDLSIEQEQRLRRYSSSIIIKGAKSPERLLDEVTLFLHQVVSELPPEQQRMIEKARSRDAALENRHILIVEDDVRNVFALTSILEPCGVVLQVARNGLEAVAAIDKSIAEPNNRVDLVLMDVMMPEMDGISATQEIRKRPQCQRLPIIMLTAKAMKDDQQSCLAAGANDYLAKPLDVEKLLSLIRVWMPRQGAGL